MVTNVSSSSVCKTNGSTINVGATAMNVDTSIKAERTIDLGNGFQIANDGLRYDPSWSNTHYSPISMPSLTEKKDGKSEKIKMRKFKVGDIVRIKSVEEMRKSSLMDDDMDRYAASRHIVIGAYYSEVAEGYVYSLSDCDDYVFDETMLEDRAYTEDDIFNITIIVPDKVVEIEFYDGKEKMVCHNDDTFDIRKCCFIAIAKHLYKKEYTQEGIEYMATQLTYQKKYVKIVDKALKDYWKKAEEKEKKIRDEREREKIQERQREKRRRYKERRTQRYKEAMVDLIADSINEAKARRKREKE